MLHRAGLACLVCAAPVAWAAAPFAPLAPYVAPVTRDTRPRITPPPEPPTRTGADAGAAGAELRRGIFTDLETFAGGVFSDVASLGSKAASFVTSEFAIETGFLSNAPTNGQAVLSSLGLNDSALAAAPTMVLNLPNYGNWTDQGWNLRFRALIYKTPNLTTSKLDDLANNFLVGTKIQDLSPPQQSQARNVTAELYVVEQGHVNVTFNLRPGTSNGASGEPGGGGGATPPGAVNQTVRFPNPTTAEGDIDGFTGINSTGLSKGNETTINQRLAVYTVGTDTGNATSYLVPEDGYTVVSDIDDILRVTKIWLPEKGLIQNTFVNPFVPWLNMPDIYANWSRSIEGLHFHYLTTTPEQITRNYMDFIYKHYPGGSFDTRPLNFGDPKAALSIRKYLLQKIFETFPHRKFILVADTSNSDVMRDYPEMATEFPGQVSCILLRNTTSTDSTDDFPYDTSHFKGLDKDMYMFFHTPDDLVNIDLTNGCVNKTIKQNVSFSEQGLPAGLSSNDGQSQFGSRGWLDMWVWTALLGVLLMSL